MRLGRRAPTDWRHVEKYPLVATPAKPVPVALGINWYTNFDRPEKIGTRYWIGRGNLGSIRGGHCVCLKPPSIVDNLAWWDFYDQGNEGACVGYGSSRMMTLLNRRRYDAEWLYHQAQLVDEWPDTPPAEGTSVSAACDVLRGQGLATPGHAAAPADGIAANRWASSWDEVRAALGATGDGVALLNSWGRSYPHIVYLTDEAGARLLAEDGEAAVVTDR